ncbi:endonuclease/exonuclease/phosphatase family protein [Peijinzhouia sedimentorum]
MRLILVSISLFCLAILHIQCSNPPTEQEPMNLTFATYNVSMESENYLGRSADSVSAQILIDELASGNSLHIKNIVKIIQTVRPDVLLLNEFDYIEDPAQGVEQFIKAYLEVPQDSAEAISYPYYYYSTSNTGIETPFDLNGDDKFEGSGNDAFGYGRYPGHYGMVLFSKYPIDVANIRTFQLFKWKDMPNALQTTNADGSPWYSPAAWQEFRLSSKSHWDVPIQVGDKTIHVLASHPTPPSFDGEEDRNGKRNHDEIRFWTDYIDANNGSYIYDDKKQKGALGDKSFVIMGDLNASPDGGNALIEGISSLLNHPKVNNKFTPSSKGGELHSPDIATGKYHTALWRMRADYVLPSVDLNVIDYGVFWPASGEPLYEMMENREASSDHRMVWVKISLEN